MLYMNPSSQPPRILSIEELAERNPLGSTLAPPFRWFGGKSRFAADIASLLPPHSTYIEPFGGTAAVLLAKPRFRSLLEVYNDKLEPLVNFWHVIQDPRTFLQLQSLVERTACTRNTYLLNRPEWQQQRSGESAASWALRFLTSTEWAFGGRTGASWAGGRWHEGNIGDTYTRMVAEWQQMKDGSLVRYHLRMRGVQIHNMNWVELFDRYDGPEVLWYLDPPYVHESRESGEYEHELDTFHHEYIVDRLLVMEGMAVLSGYYAPMYERLQSAGWHRFDKRGITPVGHSIMNRHASAGDIVRYAEVRNNRIRTESLWFSPGAANIADRIAHTRGWVRSTTPPSTWVHRRPSRLTRARRAGPQ